MMHKECEMNEKIKLKPKTKQNATKYKIHMTCQDEETRYRPMKKQGIDQCMENAHMGQGVLNTQPMNQTCFL